MPEKKITTGEAVLAVNQLKKVFGDSGTERYSGFFLEEFNSEWRDEKRVDNVEQMRRTDSTIKGVLNAIKAPILATEWRVEGGDDKVREFVEKSLFGMKRTWKEFLREALSYMDFGHYVFELIYDIRDGRISIIDLAPRIPKSIQQWELKDGRFGVVQYVRTDDRNLPDKNNQLEIPADKLLILTNDKEGDDVTGQSVLRSAYKHFKYKDVLYRIQGIAAERYGVGVPVIYLPENAGEKEKSEAEIMLENLRSNQKAYIVLPWKKEDGALEILTPNGNPQGQAIDAAIEHHDRRMLMAVLANFLGLGADSTGSFALSKDQSSFFLKHVDDKATYLQEQLDKQVVKRLVDLAFGPQEVYPKMAYNPLGDIDFKEMSEVLKSLVDAGLVKIDGKIMKFTRDVFQLPKMTDEEVEEMDLKAMEDEMNSVDQGAEFDLPEEPMDEDEPEEEPGEDEKEENNKSKEEEGAKEEKKEEPNQ